MSYFAVNLISVDRSEKVTFKYHIYNHVYACFICLIVKNTTLPEKNTLLALFQSVYDTILTLFKSESRYTFEERQNGIIYTLEERQKCIFLRLKTDTLLKSTKSVSFSASVPFLTIKHRKQA